MATTKFCTPLDNVYSTLGADYIAGSGSFTVAVADESLFGSPSASAPVRFTVAAATALDTYGRISDRTKVTTYKATGRTGTLLTGVTLDSGTDQNFATADVVAILCTATTVSDINTAVNALETATTQGTPAANTVYADSGGTTPPAFRALVAADIPSLAESKITNLVADLALKAPLASPTFTGTPAGPTAALATSTTQLATTAFVIANIPAADADALGTYIVKTASHAPVNAQILASLTTGLVKVTTTTGALTTAAAGTDYLAPAGDGSALTGITESQVTGLVADLALKAPLASPTFTGTPAAPTAVAATNTTQVATTAYVKLQAYATLASPTFTGTPAAPTPAGSDNSTTVATTAFVKALGYATLAAPSFTGGVSVTGATHSGTPQFFNAEISLGGASDTKVAVTSLNTGAVNMYFSHLGASNTGAWLWRNGTDGGTTRMTLNSTGDLSVTGVLSVGGTPSFSAGVQISGAINTGSPTFYLNELEFTGTGAAKCAISSAATGAGQMTFDFIGASNTGSWKFRNGTNATTNQFVIDASGNATSTGYLYGFGGFSVFDKTPITSKPTVTGSRGANAALASLLTALANYGLITDSSS